MIFWDERINAECSHLYRRGILYATLAALCYGALRAWYLVTIKQFYVVYLLLELAIVLCGTTILLVGALRYHKNGDERVLAERHRYYLRASKLFLLVTLAGYAWSLPAALHKPFSDMPPNWLLLMLEIVGCIYFFYQFKLRELRFNYSFIEQDSYYGRVMWNIAKLALILLPVFALPAWLVFVREENWRELWSFGAAYLGSVLGLGLQYLYISWVERVSHEEDTGPRAGRAVLITAIVALFFAAAEAMWQIIYAAVATGLDGALLNSVGEGILSLFLRFGSMGEVLAQIARMRNICSYIGAAYLAMAFSYLLPRVRSSRFVMRALRGYFILLVVEVVWSALMLSEISLLISKLGMEEYRILISFVRPIAELLSALEKLCLWLVFLGLIADYKMPKRIIIVLMLQALCNLLSYPLASYPLTVAIINAACTVGGAVWGTVVLWRHVGFDVPVSTDL